jgi:pimeloyl-ACP methyl ester carboxylesterase
MGELEEFDQPVDLVGHDWGGLLTVRLVSIRPELVRSWASDVMGAFHPDFTWHDIAQIWQTPGAGEDMFAGLGALTPEQRAEVFTGIGVPPDDALAMASGIDERMADCILKLYRSAVGVERQWGPDLGRVERPGLVMFPAADALQDKERFQQVAERAGARLVELEGVNHFWPYEAPERAAAVLRDFWESLG